MTFLLQSGRKEAGTHTQKKKKQKYLKIDLSKTGTKHKDT